MPCGTNEVLLIEGLVNNNNNNATAAGRRSNPIIGHHAAVFNFVQASATEGP